MRTFAAYCAVLALVAVAGVNAQGAPSDAWSSFNLCDYVPAWGTQSFPPVSLTESPCNGQNVVQMNRVFTFIGNPNGGGGIVSMNLMVETQAVCNNGQGGGNWLYNNIDYCSSPTTSSCVMGDWTTSIGVSPANVPQIPCPTINHQNFDSVMTCSKYVLPNCNRNCVGVFANGVPGLGYGLFTTDQNGWVQSAIILGLTDGSGNAIINQANLVDASSFQMVDGCVTITNVFNQALPVD